MAGTSAAQFDGSTMLPLVLAGLMGPIQDLAGLGERSRPRESVGISALVLS
jgi:hypothetical protein